MKSFRTFHADGKGIDMGNQMGAAQSARASSDGTRQPEADSGHDYPMPAPHATTGQEFCRGVIGPALLSVEASRLAVEKAVDTDTLQFANFELREAVAVVKILEDYSIPKPDASPDGNALLEKLKILPSGAEFDTTYIRAELANHEFLRDLAESFLQNATGPASEGEMHGRHLAALALTAFKEHVVLSKNIVRALSA